MDKIAADSCKIRDLNFLPDKFSLAMSYVPYQIYGEIYPELEAFTSGTLFPELDKPFMGGKKK